MLRSLNNKRGIVTAVEYMTLLVFLLTALLVFRGYIVRAFAGRWKTVADVFGHGRQFDPRPYEEGGTFECFKDRIHCQPHFPASNPYVPCTDGRQPIDMWVGKECFDKNCDCNLDPSHSNYWKECLGCLVACSENPAKFGDWFNGTAPVYDARVQDLCAD